MRFGRCTSVRDSSSANTGIVKLVGYLMPDALFIGRAEV